MMREVNIREINMFGELINFSGRFVEQQKGVWDYFAWIDFLSEVKNKGIDITDEMRCYISSFLESMKKLYIASTANTGIRNVVMDTSMHVAEFARRTNGGWNTSDTETFINELQKKGIGITEETKHNIVGVIESAKNIYTSTIEISRDT
ncbi:MAG: hypothetical protein HQK89_12950 [Nitrospirae bacterium]|nr:hypothetical protein [Nitrospirota bacterium]